MELKRPSGKTLNIEPREDGTYGDPHNDGEAIANEATEQTIVAYWQLLDKLRAQRDSLGRSERARYLSVAITDLETSMLRYQGACEEIY